jgi:hypothetical protein
MVQIAPFINDDYDMEKDSPEILREKAEMIADMYDDPPETGEDGLYGLELNDGLTENEIELTPLYASLSRGTMVITGPPGSGKGTFFNHLAWQNRRLFAGRKVLFDYKPGSLFDLGMEHNRYFLFNSEFILKEMDKMAVKSGTAIIEDDDGDDEVCFGRKKKKPKKELIKNTSDVAKRWADTHEVLLQNGILGIDEGKKIFNKRNPHSRVAMFYGMIISVWRHLDLLVAIMCPFLNEIDRFLVEQYMTHEIKTSCGMGKMASIVTANFYKKKMVDAKGVVNIEGRPVRIKVDGAEPRPEIGVKLLDTSFDMEDFGVKEKRVVDYLKLKEKNLANLNMIQPYADEDINILRERLLFMHRMGIVQCKRFWDIYNSKNFANLNPKLKGG